MRRHLKRNDIGRKWHGFSSLSCLKLSPMICKQPAIIGKMIAPALEELAGSMNGKVKIVKLNVDENPATAAKYGIMSIPTLMLFKNGELASRQVGAAPKQKLEQWITTATA